MKKILYLPLLIVLFGCNNNKTTTEKEIKTKDTIAGITDNKPLPKTLDDIKTGLENLTPLTEDQMKSLFPENLLGYPKSETEISTSMGAMSANTFYKINDSSSITVLIIDCGGPGGSGFFNLHYINLNKEDIEEENPDVKLTERNGQKAFESCSKEQSENSGSVSSCFYNYFDGTRLLVTLTGDHTGTDMLKKAADALKLN